MLLVLEDGQVAVGDCAAVQYSGAGGRDPLFQAATAVPFLEKHIRPLLEGAEIAGFRSLADAVCGLRVDDRPLHTALRYGITQALLDARARSLQTTKCEVVCGEWNLAVDASAVPIFGQSGDNRYENVDKMILKGVDALPHGLINSVEDKLGRDGGKLKEYVRWLAARIANARTGSCIPARHPHRRVRHHRPYFRQRRTKGRRLPRRPPGGRGTPSAVYRGTRGQGGKAPADRRLCAQSGRNWSGWARRRSIVADEWCNTLEDVREFTDAEACHMVQIKTPDLGGIQDIVESVLYCKKHGMEAYQGGTCNETEISAQCCVHLAMATHPERMLAKPGMGFDEGFTVVKNEMERIRVLIGQRAPDKKAGTEVRR